MAEGLLYDFRFAWRGLRRDRSFTLASVAMLALALALNATVFTVMDATLFRGLPLARRSDRLVYLSARKPTDMPCCPGPIPFADFEAWRAQTQTLESLAFRGGGGLVSLRDGDGRPIDMVVSRIGASMFGLLGVRPMLGRDFVPADEVPGAAAVAIISHPFWESRFGKRADVVGSTVRINGAPATVIGVMPERFVLVYDEDMWMPLAPRPGLEGGVVARLRDGATLEAARAELDTINRRLEGADTAPKRGIPLVSTYAQAYGAPDARTIYGSLWVGTWFVLLIAGANLTNLTLARTMGRWREFSTRIALGAGLSRMMRQIIVENVLLAGVAGALAWWLTIWSVRTWAAATASRYLALDYTVDAGTLGYLAAVSVVTAIVVSLVPIARIVQLTVSGRLNSDARGVTQGRRGKRLAAALVAGQMALAIVLLSGSGVLVRSFEKVVGANVGVRDPERVLAGFIRLPSDKYPDAAARLAYFERLERQVKTIPGVDGASVASTFPSRTVNRRRFEIEGRPAAPERPEFAQLLTAGPGYFRVMAASAIAGREFAATDRATTLPVAIVNQSFADTFWPGRKPLGRRLRVTDRNPAGEWRTVVGVVPNIMQGDATRQSFKPVIYVPFQQQPSSAAFFFARTRAPVSQASRAVRTAIQALDPDVIAEDFTTLQARYAFDRDYMDLEHADLRKHATIAPIFAGVALLLAAIGLVAVLAHSVTQRTKEIGVRVAIGAAAHDIRALIFREGMLPVAFGLIAGLAMSLAVNRILQSQLVGVSPYDPVTLAAAPAMLIGVALLACHIPARRAINVDPVVALRHD